MKVEWLLTLLPLLSPILPAVIQELPACLEPDTFPLVGGGCYPPLATQPCREGEWTVLTTTSIMVCQVRLCEGEMVMFGGVCVHMLDTSACPNIGERLYVGDDGEGVCDCDDGWGRGGWYILLRQENFCPNHAQLSLNQVKPRQKPAQTMFS